MNIALVSGNPHLPEVVGGVEVNTHELAFELMRRGHEICVHAKLSRSHFFGISRLARGAINGRRVWIDDDLGYPVHRSRQPWELRGEVPPGAVAVVQNGDMLQLADGFTRRGVPSVAYLHGLGFETWPGQGATAASLPFRGYIANSQFTASRFRQQFDIEPAVVPPVFHRERYSTAVDGQVVTFINPVPEKGVALALDIAALCPDIPFCFVRGWPLKRRALADLKRRGRRLGNVAVLPPTRDMRSVYRHTRVLLVPSQWESETWGRVATEAQFSGIPVIASNRGGLPEAVGLGGVLIGHDQPAAIWARALRELWDDGPRHREMSQAALTHSTRADIDPDRQVRVLLDTLERACA
jgi:glycosyltransferase involved in cell wall biosynthesis